MDLASFVLSRYAGWQEVHPIKPDCQGNGTDSHDKKNVRSFFRAQISFSHGWNRLDHGNRIDDAPVTNEDWIDARKLVVKGILSLNNDSMMNNARDNLPAMLRMFKESAKKSATVVSFHASYWRLLEFIDIRIGLVTLWRSLIWSFSKSL